jgi:hypothetical protein
MHKTVHEFIRTQVEQSGLETASSGDFVEAVFRPEIFRIFPVIFGRFLPESIES